MLNGSSPITNRLSSSIDCLIIVPPGQFVASPSPTTPSSVNTCTRIHGEGITVLRFDRTRCTLMSVTFIEFSSLSASLTRPPIWSSKRQSKWLFTGSEWHHIRNLLKFGANIRWQRSRFKPHARFAPLPPPTALPSRPSRFQVLLPSGGAQPPAASSQFYPEMA